MKYLLRNKLFGFVILCLCLYGCGDAETHRNQLTKLLITGHSEVEVTDLPPELKEFYQQKYNLRVRIATAALNDEDGFDAAGIPIDKEDTQERLDQAQHILTYHTKYIDAGGIAIIGSDDVRDEQFYAAREIILLMTSKRPELREPLSLKTGFRVILINAGSPGPPEGPDTGLLGWYSHVGNYAAATVWWKHSLSEDPDKIKMSLGVLIHEVAHAIHLTALRKLDPTFDDRLLAAYVYALENPDSSVESAGSFGLKNRAEYWAELVVDWHGKQPYNVQHTYKVRKKDQLLLPLIEEWLPKIYLRPLDDVLNAPSRKPVEWDWYSPETDAHWHRETYPDAYEDD